MKVICCGCGVFLRNVPSEIFAIDDISHGFCESCAHHFLAQTGLPLSQYLEHMPAPVLTVTQEGAISSVNNSALELLDKSPAEIQGARGGKVFECEHSRLPGGCGKTLHCSGCTIRTTVMDTMETGIGNVRVQAYLNRETSDGLDVLNILISTEKKGGVVFLKIEDMEMNA